jgi:competence protein ComGC
MRLATAICSDAKRRSGVSLIEILTVIGISGILLALLIPGVQVVRESSRRLACINKLRQVGLAVQNYESDFGVLPSASWWDRELRGYLELQHVIPDRGGEHIPVPLFACPSDLTHANGSFLNRSYMLNRELSNHGWGDFGGAELQRDWRTVSEIRDGLSNTAAFGEVLSSPSQSQSLVEWSQQASAARRMFQRVPTVGFGVADFHRICSQSKQDPIATYLMDISYRHVMPPNGWNCLMQVGVGIYRTPDNPQTEVIGKARAAGSKHPGGTHLILCDGSGRFLSENVDLSVWWALGTRAGGETPGDF